MVSKLEQEWSKLSPEFENLDKEHDDYVHKLQELTKSQNQMKNSLKGQFKAVNNLRDALHAAKTTAKTDEERERVEKIEKKMVESKSKMRTMQSELPVENNGFYLSLILGSNLNLSLPSTDQRYKYKQDYEAFKWNVTIAVIVWVLVAYLYPWRVVDYIGLFLLVWYYCTLTIRENILTMNGSKIKGWWLFHHVLSLILCGIVLIWKDGQCYQEFRSQFLLHVAYIGIVQLLQVQYQSGCLRRLHSLGQGHQMDITVEGFTSFMFKGLTFLLPFLVFGYFFQLYNSYVLWHLAAQCENEWNVWALCFLFFFLASGNIFTTSLVIFKKFRTSNSYTNLLKLTNKYRRRSHRSKKGYEHQE